MPRPSLPRMLWRGLRRRCAWCGGRKAFFTGWFAKQDRCATCGIEWRRGYEGFELGAMAISAVVCLSSLIAAMVVGVLLSLPDIDVVTLLIVLGVGAVVLPILVYPVSYTLWQAVDLAMRPPTADDAAPPAVR
ncbi:MAG: DUF983 domain-containing protein [Acidimicrobiia bacterium]|nr:DUF983 domain-containing protein [Acidimicrobiia bacterium]